MRATLHSGRTNNSPKHNDRQYDVDGTAKSNSISKIDATKSETNLYWVNDLFNDFGWFRETDRLFQLAYAGDNEYFDCFRATFAQAEATFYERHFFKQYEQQQARYKKKGNHSRLKSFDDWRNGYRYKPDETIMQIGDKDVSVDSDTATVCFKEYLDWLREQEMRYNFTVLDASIHLDETVPHVHIRQVWHSVNPDTGIDEIGQNNALERAGVAMTTRDGVVGTFQSDVCNRKITYTRECRNAWYDILERHGIAIVREPDTTRERGKRLEDVIKDDLQAKQDELDKLLVDNKETQKKLSEALIEANTLLDNLRDTDMSRRDFMSKIKFQDGTNAEQRYQRKRKEHEACIQSSFKRLEDYTKDNSQLER